MVDPWAGLKAAKDKLLAKTPPPPLDDDEDEPPYRQPVKKQNDTLYDVCIGVGTFAGVCLLLMGIGFVQEQVNDWQAREYFQKHHISEKGEKAKQITDCYKKGWFMAVQALDAFQVAEGKPQ